jgi:hypothetical protein
LYQKVAIHSCVCFICNQTSYRGYILKEFVSRKHIFDLTSKCYAEPKIILATQYKTNFFSFLEHSPFYLFTLHKDVLRKMEDRKWQTAFLPRKKTIFSRPRRSFATRLPFFEGEESSSPLEWLFCFSINIRMKNVKASCPESSQSLRVI